MNFLKIQNFLLVFLIIFTYLTSVVKTYAVDITADSTISSSSDGDQYNIKTNNDIDVIVTNNSTLERNQKIFNVSAASLTGSSITIHLGSSVIAETNSIFVSVDQRCCFCGPFLFLRVYFFENCLICLKPNCKSSLPVILFFISLIFNLS